MLFLGLACSLTAQQYHAPQVFHNLLEYVQYQCANPGQIPLKTMDFDRGITAFSQKLDSVVGSDDFDWVRWKNEYTYLNDDEQRYDDRNRVETHYVWDNQAWAPELKSEMRLDGLVNHILFSRWDGENWEAFSRATYHYEDMNGERLLSLVITESFADSMWMGSNRITYEYDEQNHMVLMMNYNGVDSEGDWMVNSKEECSFNADGNLVKKLYSSIRNGSWRENSKDTLIYDDNQRCVALVTQRKGGFGPGANTWRDASRYEFAYLEDGSLESETLYSSGWFSEGMSLNSKTQYQFDTQGNLVQKTVNNFNGADWVVRDLYENRFENTQDASSLLGMMPVWESTVKQGLGYVLDPTLPLHNQWLSCSIVSTGLDTQFDLYYSGFASVQEHAPVLLNAFVSDSKLVVVQEQEGDVYVYDLNGRVVASQSHARRCEFALKPGLYLVSNGKSSVKALVR